MTERYHAGEFIREAYQAQKENGGMTRKTFLKAAMEFVGLSLVTSACKPLVHPPETPKPTPAETPKPTPTETPRGLNEDILNLISNPRYRTQSMLDYFQRLDYLERHKADFFQLDENEGLFGKAVAGYTTIENMKLIEEVDENDSEIVEEYKSLKKLTTRCSETYEATEEGGLERAIGIYEIASQYLNAAEEDMRTWGISIVDLVNGTPGNCDDLVAAYYALFNYYHVKAYAIFGKFKAENLKGEIVTGYHTWIRLETRMEFELDPTWYKPFVPLEIRNDEIKPTYIKNQSLMRFKK